MRFEKWPIVCVTVFAAVVLGSYCNCKNTYLDCLVPIAKTNLVDSEKFDGNIFGNRDLTFLGYGMQSVAFESADKKYVLKFFTKKPFEEKLDRKNQSCSLRSIWGRWKRDLKFAMDIKYVLKNYSKLFSKNPEIAGLVAVCLNAKNTPSCLVTLHWPDNTKTICDLSQYPFVVQKKADLVYVTLAKASSSQEKLHLLNKLKLFLIARAKLGFMDKKKTMSMHKNFGFLGDDPIQFDAGNVVFNPKLLLNPDEEITQVLKLFDSWVCENRDRFELD